LPKAMICCNLRAIFEELRMGVQGRGQEPMGNVPVREACPGI